jgi:hypothetical protein
MSGHNDIIRQIREASAFENAAAKHDDKYENTMKSAGASMYAAFADALRAQPGRKDADDKLVRKIYESTAPRPWWDELLKEAGYRRDSEPRKRMLGATVLIQWHLAPAKAMKNRANRIAADAKRRELEEKKQRGSGTRSQRGDQDSVPSSSSMWERSKGHAEPAMFEDTRRESHGGQDRAPRNDDRARLLTVLAEIKDLVSDTPERLLPEVLGALVGVRDEISEVLG